MQLNTFIGTFNVKKDIDPYTLRNRAFKEAEQIYSKESTRRGRNIAQIAEACMFGHASEIWMMENGGYVDDTRKYKDLFYPYAPVEVEVKTVGYPAAVPLELKRCADRKQEAWRGFPDYVVVWIGDRKTGDYHHEGTYVWCHTEKKFKKNVSG